MSTQGIDLSNVKLELLLASSDTEPLASEETVEENEQTAPDEFEIRRRAFFRA